MSSEKEKRIENHDNTPQTGHTALQRAAAGGHLDIARLLVTQGASLDHQDELVRLRRADIDRDGDGGEELKLVALYAKQRQSSIQVCVKTAVFSLTLCMVVMIM